MEGCENFEFRRLGSFFFGFWKTKSAECQISVNFFEIVTPDLYDADLICFYIFFCSFGFSRVKENSLADVSNRKDNLI